MAEVPAGSVVEGGWLETAEGRELLGALLRERSRRRGRRSCSRRAFGLLERPLLPPGAAAADVAAYKVFVCGRSGVGKTALVAQAAGMEAAPAPQETIGIQTTPVFWPAKLRESGKALFFRFSFWDCGEAVLRKFDHILPSCLEKADGVLLLFSFTDRASFEDLPLQISRLEAAEGPPAPPLKMVVGTKFDQFAHTDVTEQDLAAFRRAWGLPVLRVKSARAPRTADGQTLGAWAGLSDVAPLLNGLAEHLWRRDQAAAGLLPP
ncbi:ciliogenesis and planar polarity effector 2 isoform X2 [Sceloporus undulatus]|uniref:ciliogenesis and planar polarity effector 2 isoform X2 n=1 Tax=Sceloporus undulatus TaxID=8520 RepID=UPI001C4C1887|nr:ciliogenesis and planar polarity effector 2 isoform X2 [Sceloporus undulatus]